MKANNQNAKTLRFLKEQGYDMPRIRAALVRLAGWEHHELAEVIGVHRTAVTNTLNESKYCRNKVIRERIAGCLDVPVEELFDEPPATETGLQQDPSGAGT